MSITKRKARAAATVLAAFTLVTMPAVPAQAASVPSCVKVKITDNKRSDIVKVTNTCKTGYRIKVIWAYETDSQCDYLPAYAGTMSSERNFPARFDGLKFCS
jgi:hypothetical protein